MSKIVLALLSAPIFTFALGAVFTKLVDYMFDQYKHRRKVRILFGKADARSPDMFFTKNVGGRPVHLVRNGFKYYGDTEQDSALVSVFSQNILEPEHSLYLSFLSPNAGDPQILPEKSRLHYVYVEDNENRRTTQYLYKGKLGNKYWIRLLLCRDWLMKLLRLS